MARHPDKSTAPRPAPPERPRVVRGDLLILVVLLVLGAALRLAYLSEVVEAPDYSQPIVDAQTHDYWARGLATNDWTPPDGQPDPQITTTPFFRPPGYPYVLAAVYKLTGGSARAARLFQMFLGLLSAVLLFLVAHRWLGRLAALLCAAAMCFWWVLLYFEGELLAPAVLLPIILGVFVLLGRWSDHRLAFDLAAASLLLGFACLVRPNLITFIPVLALWVWWVRRTTPATTASGTRPTAPPPKAVGSPVLALLLVVLPAVLIIGLATMRNQRVSGERVLISTNGGVNLFIGNNPQANGFAANELPGIGRFGTCFDHVRIVNTVQRQQGRDMSHGAVSDWFTQEALRFMRDNPGRTLGLMWKKACLMWGNGEVGNNKELSLERQHSSVLRWLPGPFALLGALAIVGAVLLWRRRGSRDVRQPVLWALFILVVLATLLPFFAAARFRVPTLPFLFLFAAFTVQEMVTWVRSRQMSAAGITLGAVAVLALVQWNLPYRYQPDAAFWHFQRGTAWQAGGHDERAEESFRTAVAIEPRHYQARHNLATLLAQRGDLEAAQEQWQEALRLQPNQAPLLGSVGAALLLQDHAAEALPYLDRAIALEPEAAEFHSNRGRALQQLGRGAEALEAMHHAAELQPQRRDAWLALAGMAQAEGDTRMMLEGWKQAARLQGDPTLANNIAWVLATHPDDEVRNGPLAQQLASAACRATDRKIRSFLDTLAAAQAEIGDFAGAVATTQESLERATQDGDTQTVEKLRRRLQLYENEQPYRDTP